MICHNDTIIKNETTYRVLYVDRQLSFVYLIDTFYKNAYPEVFDLSELEDLLSRNKIKRCSDPFSGLINMRPEGVMLNKRDENWKIIEKVVFIIPNIYSKSERVKHVTELSRSYVVSKVKVNRLLRFFWQKGSSKNALIPNFHRCGKTIERIIKKRLGKPRVYNPGTGVNINSTIEHKIKVSINKFYHNQKLISLKSAYEKFLNENYTQSDVDLDNIPTYHQYYYWYKKIFTQKESIIKRYSKKIYNTKHREILGTTNSKIKYPGAQFQIDATIADIYLVSSSNRELVVGRPIVFIAIDSFSRMITGVNISFENACWNSAALTLANCVENKAVFCLKYGIEIDESQWPCQYLPETVLGDRGEMISKSADQLVEKFGVVVQNTPAYRADWKGIVESKFRTIQADIKSYAEGYVLKEFPTRIGPDYRLDALYSLREFTTIFLACILNYNSSHYISSYDADIELLRDNVPFIPINIWDWGIKKRAGRLKSYDFNTVYLNLLKRDSAIVTENGIKYKGLYYYSEKIRQLGWFYLARDKTWNVDISTDPRFADRIYLYNNNTFEKCVLVDNSRMYKGLSFADVFRMRKIHSTSSYYSKKDERTSRFHLNTVFEDTTNKAKEEKLNQVGSKKLNVKNLRKNKQNELTANRIEELDYKKDEFLEQKSLIEQFREGDNYSYPDYLT